jgi:PAS domain-containing protein
MLVPASGIGEISELLDRVGRGETISQLETVMVNRAGGPDRGLSDHVSGAERRREVVGSSTIARDIRRRRRDREALQQSEEKYRRLVANLPDVVWVADETGRPVFVSSNCEVQRIHARGGLSTGVLDAP